MTPDFVNINNKKIPIQDWSFTLFQLCDSLGIKIPRFCYHERLSIAGNCRMCMVEVSSSLKPVVACATSLTRGMTVFTNSILAKRARENVLEFLLINHPLDCPICDQGGECDLQDQAVAYGSDKGRFAEVKRSVEDKSFGPIVKTVMTRCIHCTRCVRYFEEVAGVPVLGTMGRGKDTEISTYVSLSMLNSNISGNVIDLCPVGALTSKPHAFLYRPWELTSIETIDTTDSLCSNIRVDLKGAEIVRVLPKRNDLINDDWISDITRYGYEGLKKNRLSVPMFRNAITGEFVASSWSSFYDAFSAYYSQMLNNSSIQTSFVQFGPSVDLFTVYVSHFFSKFFNNVSYSTSSVLSKDNRSSYLISSSIASSDLFVLTAVNLSEALPVLQTRVRKNGAQLLYTGLNGQLSIDNSHIGLSHNSAGLLFRGKHSFSSVYLSSKKPVLLSDGSFSISSMLSSKISAFNKLNISSVVSVLSSVHASEVGLVNSTVTSTPTSLYYAIDATSIFPDSSFSSNVFSVYQGTNAHSDKTKVVLGSQNSWYVPSCSSFEYRGFFLNLLGYLQITRKCTTKIGLSLPNSDILLTLFVRLSKLHPMYATSFSFSASTFYSYFLDFVVLSLEDSSFVQCSATTFFGAATFITDSTGVSFNFPLHVKYSNTLSSVNAARSNFNF